MSVHGCIHIYTHHTNTLPHAQHTYATHTNSTGHLPPINACTHTCKLNNNNYLFIAPSAKPWTSIQVIQSAGEPQNLTYPHSCPSIHPRTLLWHKPGSFPVFLPKTKLLSSGKSFIKPSVRFWRLKGSLHTGGCHFEIKAYLTLMRWYSLKGRRCSGSFQNQATPFLRVGLLSGT